MYKVFSLINAPTPFCGEKADQYGFNTPNISHICAKLSKRMSFLELLNCNAAEESYRLIMA